MGALFFAMHPLRVEAVAWATSRRDPVSGLFFLLSIFAYLRLQIHEGGARVRWLAFSVLLFACSLLSKAAAMPLPLVLLALDLYPLRRRFSPILLLEKIPLFAVMLAYLSAITIAMSPTSEQSERRSVRS